MTSNPDTEVIVGPTEDARYGLILEVRPTATISKAGRFPSQAVIVTHAARRMIELSKAGQKLAAVVVRGEEHDPMAHPEFRAISENVRELVDKWFPRAQLALETLPLYLNTPSARHVLTSYDQPVVRLNAGTQKTFGALTGCKPGELKRIVSDLSHVEHRNLAVEACFVRGDADNSTDSELRGLVSHLQAIEPAVINVWTPPKALTINGKKVKPISKSRMTAILGTLADKTGVPVEQVALSA